MGLHLGDSLEVLKSFPDNSIDSIVTDPPYGLAFMGKKWDYDVPSVELWKEVLRVLKPGGHLLSFGGTRTYHRMVCNIEDAGFEIRDQVQWIYGSGFPKALDCAKQAIKEGIACGCKEIPEHGMRSLSEKDLSQALDDENQQGEVLQHSLSKQSLSKQGPQGSSIIQREEPLLAGGLLHRAEQRLSNDTIAESSESKAQRLRVGTHSGSGEDVGQTIKKSGSGSSHKSRQSRQSTRESKNIQESQRTLDGSSFPRCSRCERSIFPEGFKTALKPANEPIVLARKPISEKTVAANVLKWGTGGLNIDKSRITATTKEWEKEEHLCHSCAGGAENNPKQETLETWENIVAENADTKDLGKKLGKTPGNTTIGDIGCSEKTLTANINVNLNTSTSGSLSTDLNQKGLLSTTETKIKKITESKICSSCGMKITLGTTLQNTIRTKNEKLNTPSVQGPAGRFPSNLILDEVAAEMLDEQVSKTMKMHSAGNKKPSEIKASPLFGIGDIGMRNPDIYKDSGGASRFFYCAKTSRSERNAGLEKPSSHPTVKPIKLMTYLCRLITPPGGTILDPFMGSGSTGVAARKEGFEFIGIEKEAEYFEIAKRRINRA